MFFRIACEVNARRKGERERD